jgi:hypothetical protein
MLKGKLKEGTLWIKADVWMWKQPVTALGIPIPVSFMFQGKIPKATGWADVVIEKVSLGRLTFPESLGSIFCDGMKTTLQSGLSSGGFASIKATQMDDGQLLISMQASGTKPKVEIKEDEREVMPDATKSVYRKTITAEDLAKAFAENKGSEFSGKFVVVDGVVEKIYSASEFSGSGVAGTGDSSNKGKKDVKISDDRFDTFYLQGMNSYGYRKDPLYIKVIIKSPDVFVMDNYGDIYKGPSANIVKEKAFIKKGYRVKFLKEGRVQSDQIKNNEIEVYGVEIDGDEDIQCFDPSAPTPK